MIKILCFPSALALSAAVLGIAGVDAARADDVLGKASWTLLSLPGGANQLWARSATKNPVRVVIEEQNAPYTHYLDQVVTLTPAWKHYDFKTSVPTACGPNGQAGRLQFGQQAGNVEFKSIAITTAK